MSNSNLHVAWAAEVYASDGPTGIFREVLELAVCDYGVADPINDCLWKGKPGGQPEYRIPVLYVATQLGKVVVSADFLVDFSTH